MTVHVVVGGDNLWSISKRYGVSLSELLRVNGLPSSTAIVPGLALYIPDNALPMRAYRVKAGDNLWGLSQEFHTSLSVISAANPGVNLNPIHVNQVINIP